LSSYPKLADLSSGRC